MNETDTQTSVLFGHLTLEVKASLGCRWQTPSLQHGAIFKLVLTPPLFDVPHCRKLHGWVLIGDLSSCHVGIGFVFQWEHYVTALDLNTHNATKGLECACQSVSPVFWVGVRVSPKSRNSLWNEKYGRERFCGWRWCPSFLCIVFIVRTKRDSTPGLEQFRIEMANLHLIRKMGRILGFRWAWFLNGKLYPQHCDL